MCSWKSDTIQCVHALGLLTEWPVQASRCKLFVPSYLYRICKKKINDSSESPSIIAIPGWIRFSIAGHSLSTDLNANWFGALLLTNILSSQGTFKMCSKHLESKLDLVRSGLDVARLSLQENRIQIEYERSAVATLCSSLCDLWNGASNWGAVFFAGCYYLCLFVLASSLPCIRENKQTNEKHFSFFLSVYNITKLQGGAA